MKDSKPIGEGFWVQLQTPPVSGHKHNQLLFRYDFGASSKGPPTAPSELRPGSLQWAPSRYGGWEELEGTEKSHLEEPRQTWDVTWRDMPLSSDYKESHIFFYYISQLGPPLPGRPLTSYLVDF